MLSIMLNAGWTALIDAEDYWYISQWKWTSTVNSVTKQRYAIRHVKVAGEGSRVISMDRVVMELHEGMSSLEIEHLDNNTLNNRYENLRYGNA